MEGETAISSGGPITVDVLDRNQNAVGRIDLNPAVFDAPVKLHLLHQMVVYQEAKHRAGTASTKTRGMIKGSRKKPWRQKGTGRARVGDRASPLWRGGGVIFGPRPRDFSKKLSKKVRKAALKGALTIKRKEEKLLVVDEIGLEKIKTEEFMDWINDLNLGENILVVIPEADEKVELSSRNLTKIKVLRAGGINVRDILLHDRLVLTRGAAEKIQETLA